MTIPTMHESPNEPQKLYVRFVDGTQVMIPVPARRVDNHVYELVPSVEYDEDDPTLLWEYGPGDQVTIVSLGSRTGDLAAEALVREAPNSDPRKRILFAILTATPRPSELVKRYGDSAVRSVFEKEGGSPFPTIRSWVEKHKAFVSANGESSFNNNESP